MAAGINMNQPPQIIAYRALGYVRANAQQGGGLDSEE